MLRFPVASALARLRGWALSIAWFGRCQSQTAMPCKVALSEDCRWWGKRRIACGWLLSRQMGWNAWSSRKDIYLHFVCKPGIFWPKARYVEGREGEIWLVLAWYVHNCVSHCRVWLVSIKFVHRFIYLLSHLPVKRFYLVATCRSLMSNVQGWCVVLHALLRLSSLFFLHNVLCAFCWWGISYCWRLLLILYTKKQV